MKEEEFMKRLKEQEFKDNLDIHLSWYLDDNDNIVIDYDSIREEYEYKISLLEDIENEN